MHSIAPIQKLAWAYAALFLAVVGIGYVPGVTDDNGLMFGLFSIQLRDDLLHLGSAAWAAWAAFTSARQAELYFKIFGSIYSLDAAFGLLFGNAFLDGAIFVHGIADIDLLTRILANLPHVVIGGGAFVIGFFLIKKLRPRAGMQA